MAESLSVTLMTEQNRQLTRMIAEQGPRLRNFIRKRVPNEADAEDLLQEVFFEVIETLRLGEPVTQWGAWMYQVARNRIVDLLRKNRLWGFDAEGLTGDNDETPLLERLPSPDAGPAEAYARSVLLQEIEDALDELPKEQRDVFVAHEIEGCSFKEIAARTGVKVNTLLSRKHYAVAHLRRRLRDVFHELSETREEQRS